MFRRLCLAAFLVAATSSPATAQPNYSRVFFFGTSELDAGNWLQNPTLLTGWAALAPTADKGYYKGRWQSGPAWSDYFAEALGSDAMASLLGGNNFAYGLGWLGPLSGETPAPGSLNAQTALYFGTQVDQALSRNFQVLPSDALYVISIGSNDFDFYGRTLEQADDIANVALSHIQRLVSAGARSFLVQTLGGLDPRVVLYNQTLLNGLATINGINVSVVDTRTFNQNIALAPGFLAGLGITDFGNCRADAACLAAAIASASAVNPQPFLGNTHFYFDQIHRDTKVAEALADYAITRLPQTVPEPATVVLMALGLASAGLFRWKRR